MLAHEWRELEELCERISTMRSRYAAAQHTKNVGLIEALKNDLAKAQRQREQLVRHISTRLGSAAAERSTPVSPAAAPAPAAVEAELSADGSNATIA